MKIDCPMRPMSVTLAFDPDGMCLYGDAAEDGIVLNQYDFGPDEELSDQIYLPGDAETIYKLADWLQQYAKWKASIEDGKV